MLRLLSNDWCEKVFSSFQLNVNSHLRLKFIQNLKDNEPFENITDVRLKNLSLEIFPFYLFPNIRFIYFNDIVNIKSFKDFLKYCKKTQYLSILDCDIDTVHNNIGSLEVLKIISICSTYIKTIPDTIKYCHLLEDLYLYDNHNLWYLPSSLKNCTFLKYISISNCNFYEFPSVLCELENLTDLDISNNDIEEIPNEISNLKKLEYFKCSNIKIISLPPSIKECKKLKEIHLKFSYLEEIPSTIGELKELTSLDLRGTRICSLPETIGKCSSLEIIDLDNTNLDSLPKSLLTLKEIKEIFTDSTPFNEKNETIFLDFSRDGKFIIQGNYEVKYTSLYQNEREEKIKFIMSQEGFIVPEKYKCSICYELFKLPRTTLEGNTYCKECIVKWFSSENTDPNSNKIVEDKRFFPHFLFENDLNEYIDKMYRKYLCKS